MTKIIKKYPRRLIESEYFYRTLINPDFWIALGKSEGWETTKYGLYRSEAEFRHHDFLINLWSCNTLEEAFNLATQQ